MQDSVNLRIPPRLIEVGVSCLEMMKEKFDIGQYVTYINDDFDAVKKEIICKVKAIHPDHIIITDLETDTDLWIEEGFNDHCLKIHEGFKGNLLKQFHYCNEIAEDILANGKTKEVQKYAMQFAEIESPLVGGTDAEWIRINWGDIYIFLCDDGQIGYQVDPFGAYGAELIDMWNYPEGEFAKAIISLGSLPVAKDELIYFSEEWEVEAPTKTYIPIKQALSKGV